MLKCLIKQLQNNLGIEQIEYEVLQIFMPLLDSEREGIVDIGLMMEQCDALFISKKKQVQSIAILLVYLHGTFLV